MTSSSLRKFAEPLGFQIKNGRLFGDYQGYSVTLSDGMGYKTMMIGISLTKDDPRVNQILGFIETNRKESQIQGYSIHPSSISVQLVDKIGTMKRFTDFLDKMVALLKELSIPGSSVCWYCKNEFAGTTPEMVQVNEAIVPMHSGCVENYSQTVQQVSDEFNKEPKKYFIGFIGALLGGIVGVIPWIIVYLLGYFVGWLGLLIGFASKKGYEMLGGKPGKAKVWIILVVVVFSVLFGQFIAENISLYNLLQDEGVTDFSVFDLPAFVIELFQYEPEYQSALLTNVGLGLLFAFLGIYGLFRDLKREGKGNIATIKRLN